MVKKFVHKQ